MENKTYEDIALQKSKEHLNYFQDERVRKPKLFLTKTNIERNLKLPIKQLEIVIEDNKIVIQQANDVAMYISISNKFLKISKAQLNTIFKTNKNIKLIKLAREHETLKAYDYIENIITSIIFSYTAIETFANICISYLPDNFEYENKDKTQILGKKGPCLKVKLGIILKELLQTDNPKKTSWWNKFIELENIRNEIIHTKQVESQKRYSNYFDKNIFKTIKVNEDIIKFYGEYIDKNKKELLIEFPYGYGFDNTSYSFINEVDLNDFEKNRRGIN